MEGYKRENLITAVDQLGRSSVGREFLLWLLNETEVFTADFPQNEKRTTWQAGRRALGLQVLELCARAGNLGTVLIAEALYNAEQTKEQSLSPRQEAKEGTDD
ncbi:MAG: hypothetical protein LUE20_11045, partial [Oscillospiraceae bacterium]|nr:hypothetical protein [Oscillospiraceae bacterium]